MAGKEETIDRHRFTQMNTDKEDFLYKDLTSKIIQSAFRVHNILGPGYLEYIYQNSLIKELKKNDLQYSMAVGV